MSHAGAGIGAGMISYDYMRLTQQYSIGGGIMPNEAVDRQPGASPASSEQAPTHALPGPQPRPALTLVSEHREISYENYECFIGVSPNVSDLKRFIGAHASQTHPTLLIGE